MMSSKDVRKVRAAWLDTSGACIGITFFMVMMILKNRQAIIRKVTCKNSFIIKIDICSLIALKCINKEYKFKVLCM